MSRLNLTNFETVCCIARLGTFSAAAVRLNASQPAITARVRELESSIGLVFFQKRGRRMELTVAGRDFIHRVEPLVQRIEQELEDYAEPAGLRGTVRIGVPHVALDWLPSLVAHLQAEMPRVRFDLDVDVGASMLQKLDGGKLDVGVIAGTAPNPRMRAIGLAPVELEWLVSARVPRRRQGRAIPLADLLGSVPIWLVPKTSIVFPMAMAALHRHRADFDNVHACSHVLAIAELVHSTGGIGLTTSSGARSHLESGRLKPLSPAMPAMSLDVSLVCHQDQQQPVVRHAMQRIVDFDRLRQTQPPRSDKSG